MTSMPASRSARAITFAPRSCPSSPGLATKTLIFLEVSEGMSELVIITKWLSGPQAPAPVLAWAQPQPRAALPQGVNLVETQHAASSRCGRRVRAGVVDDACRETQHAASLPSLNHHVQ